MAEPVYILGGAQTDFARNWAREGLEIYDLFAEALREGIEMRDASESDVEAAMARLNKLNSSSSGEKVADRICETEAAAH